ncbi:SGNH/GDSL hydrolase family protein [Komagataeibacter sp. FNDCF1]|uniref:SGNH/GDSL hydrolase family protein n=1 Tax=Komagataeibacter sp. FNDCF1 TaxID=2878681 RepID=UPI001E51C26F|nr:SGNH/GDSL hydrolase family protein [Komagataeibacter sp. FNDCF1]MCE2563143.1 SGNH/GDSL hydrolase family protein [Komagataeibacter sp. FNDCF1]
MRLSAGGTDVRFRFSNELGQFPLSIGRASVQAIANGAGASPAAPAPLTFGRGARSAVVAPGSSVLTGPVTLHLPPLSDVRVLIYIDRDTGPMPCHPLGMATAVISAPGDYTSGASLPVARTATARLVVTGIDTGPQADGAVVLLGDSITDGYHSGMDRNHRFSDFVAQGLVAAGSGLGVVNAGISGNRLLHDLPTVQRGPSALSRFDRDVLHVSGVRAVVLLEGINDIGVPDSQGLPDQAVSATDIITGYRQLIGRAHASGLMIIGGTLLPFANTAEDHYYSASKERTREVVNRWIRTSGQFDAIIDFDAALSNPARPAQLRPMFDSGDHLHPDDRGYQVMGQLTAKALDAALDHARN